MTPGTSQAGRRVLLRRLYARYAADPAFAEVRAEGGGVLVPGDGPMSPRLMFVGEAPGATEAKQRKPFVGASGRFLNELLESVGLNRADIFVTNVVKYRPLDNRDPTDAEVHAGFGYLQREHRLLGSPHIVVLGKHARNALTGALKGHPIGEWVCIESGYGILPLHHPAYGIYQRANRPMMFEQFKAVLTPPENENAA